VAKYLRCRRADDLSENPDVILVPLSDFGRELMARRSLVAITTEPVDQDAADNPKVGVPVGPGGRTGERTFEVIHEEGEENEQG
jgi:hypothetical protein